MTSTKMVTRCPQCGTSFRITPAQLQSARGAVRCGACLHIFKARDHLVGAPSAPQAESALVRQPNRDNTRKPVKPQASPKSTTGAQPSPTPSPSPKSSQRPPTPGPTANKPAAKTSAPPQSAKPATSRAKAQTGTPSKQLRFDQSLIDEESSQLDDDDFLISDDMGRPKSDEESDPFGIGKQISGHSLFERTINPQNEHDRETTDDTDESWAMSLLEEEEESSSADISLDRPSKADETASPSFELVEEPTETELDESAEEEYLHFQTQVSDADPESEQHYTGQRLRAHDPERSALLMNIDPEPVEMTWTRQQRRQKRKWSWSALALVALLLVVVQVAWLQFDRLSRIEPYRSLYGSICGMVGCELPTLEDRSRIRAYNLVVRNHPDRDDALVVDAILLNNAGFAQSFPELVLEFSDLEGQSVAARRFSPDEYLSGELAGKEIMPPNQPIHLTLELVDPGEEAVNYRAYIPD